VHPDDVRALLERTGAIRSGHFRLTSGLHSDLFILCAQVQQYPRETERLARAMAEPFRDRGITVTVGAAVGGIILAYEVARALDARAVFAEKDGAGGMVLRRGFTLRPGERALVVEDALTTGGSVRAVLQTVRASGAEVVGVAALVDRTGGSVAFDVPLHALLTLRAAAWAPDACPLCRAGVPLVEPKEHRR
jgi:orotate phosphoribosyltransferase